MSLLSSERDGTDCDPPWKRQHGTGPISRSGRVSVGGTGEWGRRQVAQWLRTGFVQATHGHGMDLSAPQSALCVVVDMMLRMTGRESEAVGGA